MSAPAAPHVVVVDAPLRRAMVRELWWQEMRARTGRLSAAAALGWLLGVVVATGRAGPAFALVAVLLLAAWTWARVQHVLAVRLPLGQQVTVSVSGESLAIHDTDEVWLPRGSATRVERLGVTTIVLGRTVSAIVPTAALTDAHAAFLEGHGAIPEEAAGPSPDTGRGCTVTSQVLGILVAARRRSYLRSGIFGLHVLTGLLFAAVSLAVALGEASPGFLVLLVVPVLDAWAVHRDLGRGARALVEAHPLGSWLAVHLDSEGTRVSRAHGTVGSPWSTWQAVRVRPDTVELRPRPGRPLGNLTLPSSLFSSDDLDLVRRHVGREFR